MEQQETGFFDTNLDNIAKAHLLETVRWTKFLAILGFVGTAIMILGAIFIMSMGGMMSQAMGGMLGAMGSIGLGILYLVFAVIYIIPVISLYKFSTNMKNGINTNNQDLINEGFRHQKNMYRFFGIISIIFIVLYLLIFIFGGIGAMMG